VETRPRSVVVVAVCGVLLAGGCSTQSSSAATALAPGWPTAGSGADPAWPVRRDVWPALDPPPSVPAQVAWPAGVSSPMRPTGLRLAGGTEEQGLAVDGAGMVWVDGPWQVARVDPRTGAAQVFDASDDAAFGTVASVARSATAGVWLVESDHLRLFDGRRFVVDLEVPPEYRGTSGVAAVVERGDEVWIGTDAGVARWSDGRWTAIGLGQVAAVTAMAVDSEAAVWVAGEVPTSRGRRAGVARLEDRGWVFPAEASAPVGRADELAADPTGGMVVRSGSLSTRRIHRFDGEGWTDLTPGLAEVRPGGLGPDGVLVGPDGWVWVVGAERAVARSPSASWRVVAESAVRRSGGVPGLTGLGWSGGTLVASDPAGLVGLEGGSFDRLWTDPARPGGGLVGDAALGSDLVAVDRDEVWVDYRPTGLWLPRFVRHARGEWSTTSPPLTAYGRDGLAGVPVLATDGGLWQVTAEGLARFADDAWSIVDPGIVGAGLPRDSAVAGPAGSLWLLSPDGSQPPVQVDPDGRRREVRLPDAADAALITAVAAQQRGPTWVAIAGGGVRPLDGRRWGSVTPLPDGYLVVLEAVLGGDGALWAVLLPEHGRDELTLARLADGRWHVLSAALHQLSPTDAGVCAVVGSDGAAWWLPPDPVTELACFDARGGVRAVPLPVPADAVAVAPDGALWIVGEQLARVSAQVSDR
jgi:hypothetical protein